MAFDHHDNRYSFVAKLMRDQEEGESERAILQQKRAAKLARRAEAARKAGLLPPAKREDRAP